MTVPVVDLEVLADREPARISAGQPFFRVFALPTDLEFSQALGDAVLAFMQDAVRPNDLAFTIELNDTPIYSAFGINSNVAHATHVAVAGPRLRPGGNTMQIAVTSSENSGTLLVSSLVLWFQRPVRA